MNKKGFTLIEIIVVIALLAIVGVGSTIAVVTTNNKKENNLLIANEDKFQNAIDVYLSNHPEVVSNINNNVEGAIISLELLKNEGLINSELKIDYENNYYVVTNALLSKTPLTNQEKKEGCNNSIELNIIPNWKSKDENLTFCIEEQVIPEDDEKDYDPYSICGGEENKNLLSCKIITNAINERNNQDINFYKNNSKIELKLEDVPKELYYRANEKTVFREEAVGSGTGVAQVETNLYTLSEAIYETEIEEGHLEDSYGRFDYIFNWNDKSCKDTKYFYYSNNITINTSGIGFIYKKVDLDTPIEKIDKSAGHNIEEWFFKDAYDNPENWINRYFYWKVRSSSSGSYYDREVIKILDIIPSYKDDEKNLKIKYKVYYKPTPHWYEYIIEKSLYKELDNYGYSYYYRGKVIDNYINFNNMCWQIVRILGDGSIKLILKDKENVCSKETIESGNYSIGKAIYGYLYTSGAGNDHGISLFANYENGNICEDYYKKVDGEPSFNPYKNTSLKQSLETWFYSKKSDGTELFNDEIKSYIKKEKICLGVKSETYENWESGIGNNYSPSGNLMCDNDTAKTLPTYIAPITIDEAYLSGNSGGYLSDPYGIVIDSEGKEPNYYHTITPENASNTYGLGFNGGRATRRRSCDESLGYVRPTIILKAGIKWENGSGTVDDPYQVKLGEE